MSHNWIRGVLADLQTYCDLNNLPELRDSLSDAEKILSTDNCAEDGDGIARRQSELLPEIRTLT